MNGTQAREVANSRIWTIEVMFVYFNDAMNLRNEQYEQWFGAHEVLNKHTIESLNTLISTVKEHMAHNFTEQRQAVSAALAAADRAVAKAEAANEKRFESVNEFRNTLADQQRNLMPRVEAENLFRSVNEKLIESAQRIEKAENRRGGGSSMLGYIIGAFGLLLTILSLINMYYKG